ncbi:MAG: hypothetical protein R6U44_11365 [Archaeoglobaceae archaeon]
MDELYEFGEEPENFSISSLFGLDNIDYNINNLTQRLPWVEVFQ